MATAVYDFLSGENSGSWVGVLQPALRRIQKQVHPRHEIEDDALSYLEELIYRLLAQMCAAQPHTMTDVETYVQSNFAAPIDAWALSDAKLIMERSSQRRRANFVFPVERLYPLMQKEVFRYNIELNVVQYIMAILDYVSADILKLAGNFVKNTRKPAIYISFPDIKVSMSADPALQALFQPLQSGQVMVKDVHSLHDSEPSSERKSMTYDNILRDLINEEQQYIRHLNLILKVFRESFLASKRLFPQAEVDKIFGNLQELLELSVQLMGSLDECIEMAGEVEIGGEGRYPQAGFVFEELAESYEFEVYSRYTENYMNAIMLLEELLGDSEVVSYFRSQETKLFKEAVQFILPKSLLEPIYHCFYYFEVLEALKKTTPSEDDLDALDTAEGCMVALKIDINQQCARFLPKRKEDAGMFGYKRLGYQASLRKVAALQQKLEGWEGSDLLSYCTELIMDGTLGVVRDGSRRKTERHVFLLDGLALCCKQKPGGASIYRLKEKINMRKAKLIDMEESDDLKFSFQLVAPDQQGFIFYAISKPEKNEWMAALTHLLTRSTFDRLLDAKLREEELTIPVLRPAADKYKFSEEDSEKNIIFDEDSKVHTGPGTLVKAGTIYKLVERLTYHEYADPAFVRTFLMTYRSFSQPMELLELVIARFQIPSPVDLEDQETRRDPIAMKAMKRFKANFASPIQLRVCNVLRHWVEFHYYDFERDPQLLARLKQFVGSVRSKNMQSWVRSINKALQKKEDMASAKPVFNFNREPDPVEWHITQNKDEFNILALHPVEIARQLTLIMSEYFRAIHPSELVDASWMKEQKRETASPNLLRLNRFETTISNWLMYEVVFTENAEERVALLSRLVDIMAELQELNNFAGMFTLNAALESASVYRLKHTFRSLSQKRQQVLEDIKSIASSDRGYKNYKEKLRRINPPCIPFLGMYMSWIVFIRDGNENKIAGQPDHFINFKKRRKIADVLQEIQQYQNTPYCLNPEQSIQEFILSQDAVGQTPSNQWEDLIFDQSRIIEPKDQPPKKAARKYKFDTRPPSEIKGISLVGTLTLISRKPKQPHAPIPPVLQAGSSGSDSHDQQDEVSPGPGSMPSSPSPYGNSPKQPSGFENGGFRDKAQSVPARPPKPKNSSTSSSSLVDVPLPTLSPLGHNFPPVPPRTVPPKPSTLNRPKGKPPAPDPIPEPVNDGPPLPPRERPHQPKVPAPPLPPKGVAPSW